MLKLLPALFMLFSFLTPLNASLINDDEKTNLRQATILMNSYATHIKLDQWSALGSEFEEKITGISALMNRLEAPTHLELRNSEEYTFFLIASMNFVKTMEAKAVDFMSSPELLTRYQHMIETQEDIPQEVRNLPKTCSILSTIASTSRSDQGKK